MSTATALIPFTVVPVSTTPSIIANPTTVTIAGSATATTTGTANVRLSAAPAGTVAVTLTRSGSTAITSSPGTISFTSSNWQAGVTVTFTAAAGTTAASSTFAAAATNYTGASIAVNRTAPNTDPPGRVDNPYAGATRVQQPAMACERRGGRRIAIANQPTGVWFDRISAITGNGGRPRAMGLVQHLNEAVRQDGQWFVAAGIPDGDLQPAGP